MVSQPPTGNRADGPLRIPDPEVERQWQAELSRLLAGKRRGGGINPPWDSAEPCKLLNAHVAEVLGIRSTELASAVTWQLILRSVSAHESKTAPRRPMLVAYLLLGLGTPGFYPRTVSEPWPEIGCSLKEAQKRVDTSMKPALHDPQRAGHRQALAIAVEYPAQSSERSARKYFSGSESQGVLDTAKALLEQVLERLRSDQEVTAARADALKAVERRRAGAVASSHDSTDDVGAPSTAPGIAERLSPAIIRSTPWARLKHMSRLLAQDLDSGVLRDEELIGLSAGLYVSREIEDDLFAEILDPRQPSQLVVRADAGHGKSSLLWSLHRRLSVHQVEPLLLSSTWLLSDDGQAPSLTPSDLLDVIRDIHQAGLRPVVLLDTADLLLHDERLRLETRVLLDSISDLGVDWVITSRPHETRYLRLEGARFVPLAAYSDAELDDAVQVLAGALCPDVDRGSLGQHIRSSVARGQPVSEVCRSPLLLRLLFELNAPNEPALEIDTSGLYARFWQRRVQADPRSDTDTSHRPENDLGATASAIAIAMLAEGTPDCPEAVLAATVPRVLAAMPAAARPTYPDGLETLRRRGVVYVTQGRVRFLHQTMFEYAAAQGLFQRHRDSDLDSLLARVRTKPQDLLTGAVLEHLLIVSGYDTTARTATADVVHSLLQTDEVALHEIGLTALAHHPRLLPTPTVIIEALPISSVRHLAHVLPTIYHSDEAAVMDLLASLWMADDEHLRLSVVEALSRISHRIPADAARFAREHDICVYVVEHQAASPTAQRTLPRLISRTASIDPSWARDALRILLDSALSLGEGRAIATALLTSGGAIWEQIGSEQYLDQIVASVVLGQARRDTDSRSVRESLGVLYAAQWRLSGLLDRPDAWNELVAETLAALQDNDESISAGAAVVALMYVLAESPDHDPRIPLTLDAMLSMGHEAATRQLQRSALPVGLATPSPLASQISRRLQDALEHLVDEQASELEVRLGEVARLALANERVTSDLFLRTLPDSFRRNVDVWLDRRGVVMLTARASALGVAAAQEALAVAILEPTHLDVVSRNLLLDGCVQWNRNDPELIRGTVQLSISLNRIPPIQDLCRSSDGPALLERHADDLRTMISRNLASNPKDQSAGARLMLELMTAGVLPIDLSVIESSIHAVTHPEATAALIRSLALFIHDRQPAIADAIQLCRRYLSIRPHDTPQLSTNPSHKRLVQPVVLDACRDTWLELAAFDESATAGHWPTVLTLTLSPRLLGKQVPDLTGFGNAGRFISGLAVRGEQTAARDALLELVGVLQDGRFSKKQIHTGIYKLRSAVRTVVIEGSPEDLNTILTWLPGQNPVVAALMARSIVQHAGSQGVQALIDSIGSFHDSVQSQINEELRQRKLVTGAGAFPEIL
ncbi:hypothetical protein [Kribbella ginsengisoli]|uniref:NACHT domain-containing protein n=1 Tax=Kribbella ginsengisoli TaxID=363865 RepID=A0ABP6VNB9_9ACTN